MPEQDPRRYPELASFGEELRREREVRGISLKEIADATKISKRFLEAIERNDHRMLPAPVFTRGFVREYARYLGLNSEEIVNRYNFAAAGDDRIEHTPHLERLTHPLMPELPKEVPKKRGLPSALAGIDRSVLVLLLIVAALGGVSWWAIQQRRSQAAARAESLPPPVVTVPALRVTTAIAPAAATPTETIVDDGTLRMTVEATDDSWITLEADGAVVLNTELVAGERREFEARERFRFRTIGNAAGVIVTLNSLQVPPLGADGEVVKNRVFNRESLERLRREESGNP
ncbi:MAG TPA: RodZ domain-containing protein [Thermoanaerobaculia bacterium]|nr:RodZ domain-containing protein [Thermoanaerobaculia bacterium]